MEGELARAARQPRGHQELRGLRPGGSRLCRGAADQRRRRQLQEQQQEGRPPGGGGVAEHGGRGLRSAGEARRPPRAGRCWWPKAAGPLSPGKVISRMGRPTRSAAAGAAVPWRPLWFTQPAPPAPASQLSRARAAGARDCERALSSALSRAAASFLGKHRVGCRAFRIYTSFPALT